jgi:putative lipoprotein
MTYREVFAVVKARKIPAPADGFGMDYPGALEIEAVLYAGSEGPGCDEDWSAFHYRTYGNEPFWSAEVSDDRLSLSRLGHEDRRWREITRQHTPASIRYIGTDAAEGLVELTITEEPCRDSMSGAYFGFSAVLRMGEEELHGCALPGER